MVRNLELSSIQNFVKKQIQNVKSSIIIIETAEGFRVNNFRIQYKDNLWVVIDPKGTAVKALKNRRLAVLYAAALVKKKYSIIEYIHSYDKNLDGLKHDKLLFEYKISKKNKIELFEDRYSRTIFELDNLYKQIFELEKSVGLQ
jgi:hypothetical protein